MYLGQNLWNSFLQVYCLSARATKPVEGSGLSAWSHFLAVCLKPNKFKRRKYLGDTWDPWLTPPACRQCLGPSKLLRRHAGNAWDPWLTPRAAASAQGHKMFGPSTSSLPCTSAQRDTATKSQRADVRAIRGLDLKPGRRSGRFTLSRIPRWAI